MKMLFVGYALVWVVLFGYMMYVHGQQRGLAKELSYLKEVVSRSARG